ncbi:MULTISPECIES: type ISP restriction/modification enzyme [unclassified Streptomyces]|uniref:type ISP restriction/modification enzyme n=1 Tax=unclassified Streptomyces TaxID=2593676 RepID=UPI00380363F3
MLAVSDEAPTLADLMPWSTAPLRLGRSWVLAPEAATLTARWDRLLRAEGDERERLFQPSRARTTHTGVAQLPGHPVSTARLEREDGPCAEPVRVLHGPYDQQWLLPDQRLIDAARPELWRVADDTHQLYAVELARLPQVPGPPLTFSALLPDGHSPAGRPGRVRPLFRRPGGADPNFAPGLLAHLAARLGVPVPAQDMLAWIAATGTAGGPVEVPLTADPELWAQGVALGRRLLWLHTRGARYADPAADRPAGHPRLPGGRRPYVRAALPDVPREPPSWDAQEEALVVGDGRIAPVPEAAWEFHAGGTRVLETWFALRTEPGAAGTLDAVRPAYWPRARTTELLELISVLALLAEERPRRRALAARVAVGPLVGAGELRAARVLPVPEAARRPASVLDHHEEGPDGQFVLL